MVILNVSVNSRPEWTLPLTLWQMGTGGTSNVWQTPSDLGQGLSSVCKEFDMSIA